MLIDCSTDNVTLYHADCRETLRQLADNSIDSVVTDPPYALVEGSRNGSPQPGDMKTPYGRSGPSKKRGFMGKEWDTGDVAHDPAFWAEVLRVLKPGGHIAVFGGTRTYHRMACSIEDAGFEIRDSLMWIYGSGFPKSHDVSKGIDKAAGAEWEVIGRRPNADRHINGRDNTYKGRTEYGFGSNGDLTAPATDAARQWQGWGTALKPAFEPIVLARKPLSGKTVAANVLKWGTGAINVDGCRVGTESTKRNNHGGTGNPEQWRTGNNGDFQSGSDLGRWPANVCHDGSDEVVGMFLQTTSGKPGIRRKGTNDGVCYGRESRAPGTPLTGFGDSDSAARFFYSAKASRADRAGSKHPTVKPIALMQWLARLITPPGGTILDPFAGSGTTGIAAQREGFACVMCEREEEYVNDISRRFK
jgi:site-specific DNA-methyltransferase (adenine-specific)